MLRLSRLAFVVGVVFGVSQAASAADLPVKGPYYKAPPLAVYNWTGCYVGANAGGGWARTEFTNTVDTTGFGDLAPGDGFTEKKSGFVGGGQLGCNYQVNQFVFGVEGTYDGSTIKGDLANTVFGVADDVFTAKIKSIATFVGRVGIADNNWLFYAKGGYAGADVEFSVSDTVGPALGSGSDSKWLSGWTGGVGIEYGVTPNWIVGLEYDYMKLQTKSYEIAGTSTGNYTFDVNTRVSTVLARVSYKFTP